MPETMEIDLTGAPQKIAAILEEYDIDSAVGIPSELLANAMLMHLQAIIQITENVRFVDAFARFNDGDDDFDF